jgi:Protein of unknown function (DUF2281)
MMNEQSLVEKFQRLPKQQQQQIMNLINSLLNQEKEGKKTSKRILGLNRGEIIMIGDFDEPLIK